MDVFCVWLSVVRGVTVGGTMGSYDQRHFQEEMRASWKDSGGSRLKQAIYVAPAR